MPFSIEPVAREYVYRRFPSASIPEKEKIINDWVNKISDSEYLVSDFKKRVGEPKGKKILDVGSGPGGVSIAFALAGADVSGVDIEKELYDISLLHAQSYGVNPHFFLYDGDKLPFPDNTFDYSVSVSVIEHTTSPENYLREILRVTKNSGKCYLGFPNKLWPKETHTGIWLLTYVPSFLRPFVVSLLKRNPLPENNLHFYTYFNLKKMLGRVVYGGSQWSIVKEEGDAKSGMKKVIKDTLGSLGVSYKAFLPHILVILEKKNKI